MDHRDLIKRITDGDICVGIVGLGYVGLPLVLAFGKRDIKVIGFDVDKEKSTKLLAGESYIEHIPAEGLKRLVDNEQFRPTTDPKALVECDAILLCVPTPHTQPRTGHALHRRNRTTLAPHLRRGQLVILESTTCPRTTEGLLRTLLSQDRNEAGTDFLLAYSPEREDPGNPNFGTSQIPKLVGGLTPQSGEASLALYNLIIDRVVQVSSPAVAEMSKLLENIFRSVNIALVNELKVLCHRMGLDVWEIIDAAATKPFGFMPFYPGPGLGGHCIPIDPFYLTWKAREYELNTRFIELAGEVNGSMPRYVVERCAEALNLHKKALNGADVLVLGLAYKKDVDDVRESPALRIIELLRERGADVSYHDPHVPSTHKMRRHDLGMSSVELTDERLSTTDAVLIVTEHSGIDYERIVRKAPLIIDTRNATRNVVGDREKIVKA
ncbi:MAG: nucleotide sugar dehydrogenase [Myxococcota bacterium]